MNYSVLLRQRSVMMTEEVEEPGIPVDDIADDQAQLEEKAKLLV